MADGGGQKPVMNSLLSAATGSSFFDEAAMLVPVTLVEPESVEPAIAEIDLNSDDSSSNRGSVEKELMEPVLLNEVEEKTPSPVDEVAAPISLFSRATTGVDAFTRMLTGGGPKPDAPIKQAETEKEIIVLRPPGMGETNSMTEFEPVFSGSSANMIPSPVVATPPPTWSGLQQPVTAVTTDNNVVSTSSLFHPSATSFPEIGGSFNSSSSTSTTYFGVPTEYSSKDVSVVGTAPAAPIFVPTPAGSVSGVPSLTGGAPIFPPLNMSSNTGGAPVIPASVPTPSITPGASNAFRLGSQRMKYVPCREIPSVPSLTPTIPSPVAAPPQVPAQTFVPPAAPPPYHPPNTANGLFSSTGSPQIGSSSGFPGDAGGISSSSYAFGTPTPSLTAVASPLQASRPSVASTVQAATAYFPHPPEGQQFIPQRLSPLTYHWFHRKDIDGKTTWKPFSIIDSVALEDAFANDPDRLVSTDGGRYDVSVKKRVKMAVYWEEAPVDVRRGSWFFKGPMDKRFVPYDEEFSKYLEKEYSDCMSSGVWQKRLEFPDGESVILHNAGVVVHFCQAAAPDDWGNLPESQIRPRVVKRGCDEMEVEDGEAAQVDHLVFVVHGIGPICDFKLRNIVEAVDDFRGLSFQLINSHFRESIEKNMVGRVEFLPVSWHKALHGDKGIDEQLKRITLRSIPKFRDFTNDTLLDILFYTSPMFCQTIITSVGGELNRLYKLFLTRNPSFKGQVSLTGHSLGSLILFDLLAHQPRGDTSVTETDIGGDEQELLTAQVAPVEEATPGLSQSRIVSYTVGNAGTGQPYINYPPLDFNPTAFFALGSPIAMFVTVRGIENLGNDFRLPTCAAFFNIFHPYDPVAYRMETLIDPTFDSRPVLIPHHKGRKRIHLELKDTMARVGADIKQRVVDAFKNTWNTVYQYTGLNKTQETIENEIQNAIVGEMEKRSEAEGAEDENKHLRIGSLNGGRRIDHVLQEAPYETFNEYVFAMSTHVGYWESEDTMLLILTEIYEGLGIQRDRQPHAAQGVVSPNMIQPSPYIPPTVPIAQAYAANIAPFSSSFQPSAPPASDYAGTSTMHYSASSPVLAAAAFPTFPSPASLVSTPSASVPLMPLPNQSTEVGAYLPPNQAAPGVQSPPGSRPTVIGNRPVTDPTYYPRGMDPTAPMITLSQVGPPPKVGFVPKQN